MQVVYMYWRMVCCSLYPSSWSHIASRPYGHKTGTQNGNINFKKHIRMHQVTLFQDKKSKDFLGRRHSPLPRPILNGEGDTPPRNPPPRRLRRSIPAPSFRKSWIRHCLWLVDAMMSTLNVAVMLRTTTVKTAQTTPFIRISNVQYIRQWWTSSTSVMNEWSVTF